MRAILSLTTKDEMKSKVLSPNLSQLVFDAYITPTEFAKVIEKYDGKEFELIIDKRKEKV